MLLRDLLVALAPNLSYQLYEIVIASGQCQEDMEDIGTFITRRYVPPTQYLDRHVCVIDMNINRNKLLIVLEPNG